MMGNEDGGCVYGWRGGGANVAVKCGLEGRGHRVAVVYVTTRKNTHLLLKKPATTRKVQYE